MSIKQFVRVIEVLVAAAIVMLGMSAAAIAKEPIRIGVIAPWSWPDGKDFYRGAEIAAAQINASGGILGRKLKLYSYDSHASATQAVSAFQRAVKQDHVVAMVGGFVDRDNVAMQPWAGRLKTPFIEVAGFGSHLYRDEHKNYNLYKYTFQEYTTSNFMARSACDFAKDVLVDKFHFKTAVTLVEQSPWSLQVNQEYQKCLPKAGLKILHNIVMPLGTKDFTPIISEIRKYNPDVAMTGIAAIGATLISQLHQAEVPVLLAGPDAQGSSPGFWEATNGAAQGLIVGGRISVNGAPVSKLTPAFYKAFVKRFGKAPPFSGYTTYDAIYTLRNAIVRAGTTDAGKLVTAIEKTHRTGVTGPISFYSRHQRFAHCRKFVPRRTSGVYTQWQNGKQVVVWPKRLATGNVILPKYMQASR